jgi:hypothetical protein
MKQLLEKIIAHDFYYMMSDDHRRYEEGLETDKALTDEIKKHQLPSLLGYLDILRSEIINRHKQ